MAPPCRWPGRKETLMTAADVFAEASKMPVGTRLVSWQTCGGDKHPIQHLQYLEPLGNPIRYCARCWTAFGANGEAINPPPTSP